MIQLVHDSAAVSRRDPVKTREKLLLSAFQQIHEHGFQAVSLDAILRDTGVTKGALYHHFPNKNALGYAVVDELIGPSVAATWIEPIAQSDDPLTALQELIRASGQDMSMRDLKMGCPLNNLSQEMSATDEGFRQRLDNIYKNWREQIAAALERGKQANTVASHVDADTTAAFLVASLEGCIGMAKNAQDMDTLMQCGLGVIAYLETLKAQQAGGED